MQVIKPGLVKGPWRPEEDEVIMQCLANGITKWSQIALRIPGRIGKQCRERYYNHLDSCVVRRGSVGVRVCLHERSVA